MATLLVLLIGVAGVVYLRAATRGNRVLVYILKPGTMLLVILLAALRLAGSPAEARPVGWAVLAGLFCSVAGDVFLMLPRERFIAGLVSFLAAHLWYSWAMYIGLAGLWAGEAGHLTSARKAVALVLLVAGVLMFRRLSIALRERGQLKLILPVAVYSTAISVMVWLALFGALGPDPLPYRPVFAAAGAVLFYLSDSALAWDKFVQPLPARDVLVMSTYFVAQTCFALAIP